MAPWMRYVAGMVLVVLIVGGGYLAVQRLTPEPFQIAENTTPSLEADWNRTIARLGIDPVYPPEEDLVVGDLLARVVSDEDDPVETKNNKLDPQSPFLRRTVKLAHVDLREQLGTAYAMLTVFPAAASPPAALNQTLDQTGSISPSHASGTRVFTHDMLQGDLPRAAFPSLKIQGSNNAATGVSAGGRGSASFAASNEGVEELHLTDVRTYGLPSARALEALSAYCAAEKTKDDCLETTARKHLERYVGPRIYNQYVDDKGINRFGVTVEIALVNRVYLTGSILHVRRSGSTQGAGLRAAKRSAEQSATEAPEPAAASSRGGADGASAEEIKKRLADVEAQLSKLSPGGALTFESASGSEILLKETFDRPVAIGIRTVQYDFSDQTQPRTAAIP
jgi:hypothetical protein